MARYVFRGLNKADLERINADGEKKSIKAKRPNDTEFTLYQFITSATRRNLQSRFISLTDDPSVADIKYASLKYQDRVKRDSEVIVVDLDRLEQQTKREAHLAPAKECSEEANGLNDSVFKYSEADNEIICENEIPADCYYVVQPLLLDILTGYSMEYSKNGIDKVCDQIFAGKSEELVSNLLKSAQLNDIEKFFVEKYYGVIFNEDGSISINKAKNQPLRGDIFGVEEEIKKQFHIVLDNPNYSKTGDRALLARCIQTGVIRKLDYKTAQIDSLPNYTAPIREMAKAEYIREGRIHQHCKRPPNPFNWIDSISENKRLSDIARSISNCLRFDPKKFRKYKIDRVKLPKGITYTTLPDGKIGVELRYQVLERTEKSTIFRREQQEWGPHKGDDIIRRVSYTAEIPRAKAIKASEVVEEAIQGSNPLTMETARAKAKADSLVKAEERQIESKDESEDRNQDNGNIDPSNPHDDYE